MIKISMHTKHVVSMLSVNSKKLRLKLKKLRMDL